MASPNAFRQYAAQAASAALPQENEIVAFTRVNAELADASDPTARLKALHRNHQLWSIIVRDVAMDANPLPQALKDQLARLGLWSMQYSLAGMTRDLPVKPLTDVNGDMIDALRAQLEALRSRPAPQPVAAPLGGSPIAARA